MTLFDDHDARIEHLEKKVEEMAHDIFWNKQAIEGTQRFLQIESVTPEELEALEEQVKQTRDYRG